jgi:hypothetical protein
VKAALPLKAGRYTSVRRCLISTIINDLFHRVLPRLVELKTSFKIPATLEGLIEINSGMAGESQIGKIVTVYPESYGTAAEVARQIDAKDKSITKIGKEVYPTREEAEADVKRLCKQ